MNAPIMQRRVAHRIFKCFVMLAVFCALAITTLLASLWLEHRTEVTLPTPTGPFAVGRVLCYWTDAETVDTLAPVPGTKRELLVWIWYPAAGGKSTAIADYLPARLRAAVEHNRSPLIGMFLTRDLAKVHAHSLRNPSVSSQQRSYPVVIMRAGASLEVWNYSTLAEDLASHGYVVVGFDAPYRSMVVILPDGHVITRLPQNNPELCLEMTGQEQERCANRLLGAWTSDMVFALDRLTALNASDPSGTLTGRLDMSRVGAFGHSFGGATVAEFCHEDSRCKAGIDVDGALHGSVIRAGINRPFMLLLSDHSRESDPQASQILANMQSVYERLPPKEGLFVEIRGANHFLFTDDGALLKSRIVLRILRTLGIVRIDGRRQLAATAYCLRSFFDSWLKGAEVSQPKIPSSLYPELQILE
jgi:predicted dienelactone hydrolase